MGYKKGSPGHIAWRLRANQKRKDRAAKLRKYKETVGCCICGYNENGLALDFDHIDPTTKKFNVSSRMLNLSQKLIDEEIAKCRVMCANCHRIHSYGESQFNMAHITNRGGSCGV